MTIPLISTFHILKYGILSLFLNIKGGSALLASSICLALYLTDLIDRKCSSHVISATVYGIKWAHSMNNLSDPTDNTFVTNLLNSAKRT